MEALLHVENVTVQRSTKTILGPITWQINEGERWVILGPNGAGKTTLLQLLAALIHPTQGRVEILGGRSELLMFSNCAQELDSLPVRCLSYYPLMSE
jgi:ABC-type molybdenum transport system ATPase subunit/photorepair protein PhrA